MRTTWRALTAWTSGAILAGIVVLPAQKGSPSIKTPFQMVPLWTEEMMSHLTGERPPACSGVSSGPGCERLNTGICDGYAHFVHLGKRPREH